MAKIESLPLNIVLQLVKKEIMDYCQTTHVLVVSVGFNYELYDEEDDTPLMAMVDVTTEEENFTDCNGLHPWCLMWDEEMCEFNTVMRWDQKEDEEDSEDNGAS